MCIEYYKKYITRKIILMQLVPISLGSENQYQVLLYVLFLFSLDVAYFNSY